LFIQPWGQSSSSQLPAFPHLRFHHDNRSSSSKRLFALGYTTSADHPRVSTGNPPKIPAGFVPVALDQNIPTGQAGSGWRSQNFAGTCGYLHLLTATIYELGYHDKYPGKAVRYTEI
jgi:hypothetical protein